MVDPLSFSTLRRVKKTSGCHYVGRLEKDAFFKFLSLNFIMCDDDAANTIPRSRCPLPPPRLFPDPCDYERPFLHHQRVVQRLTLTGQPRGALAVRAISTIREHDDDSRSTTIRNLTTSDQQTRRRNYHHPAPPRHTIP